MQLQDHLAKLRGLKTWQHKNLFICLPMQLQDHLVKLRGLEPLHGLGVVIGNTVDILKSPIRRDIPNSDMDLGNSSYWEVYVIIATY